MVPADQAGRFPHQEEGSEPQVALAAVAGAHGIGGEVRLKLFAEALESVGRHTKLRVGERELTLKALKGGKTPIARFAEVTDRTGAEALRGSLVTVARSALPPLGDGEYYHADLIGLSVESAEGEDLGVVIAVENFGAGDVLEIRKGDGKAAMVPFRPGIADFADNKIVADPAFLA